jgi:hypothetical protein
MRVPEMGGSVVVVSQPHGRRVFDAVGILLSMSYGEAGSGWCLEQISLGSYSPLSDSPIMRP